MEQEDPSVKKMGHAACIACRSRKAKCSGSTPCTNCVRREEECRYEEWKVRGRKPSHLKAEFSAAQILNKHSGLGALFHGEPLRASELVYVSKFFIHVHPCMPCVRRGLVESIINTRSGKIPREAEDVATMACNHMLIYAIVAVGAQVAKEPVVAKQYLDLANQGLSHVLERPSTNGLIALFVATYYYFGMKSKSALACHCMSLSHIAYILKRKKIRLDPLINQTVTFFEKIVLVKLQKTRELYRLPTAEELAPLEVSPSDPIAVDAAYGRMGDICVMLVCIMIGTRWQVRLDDEAAAVVQQLLSQLDKHTQYVLAASPSTVTTNVLALVCGLKSVFLHKAGHVEGSVAWAGNMRAVMASATKAAHCFLLVIVVSNINEILVRQSAAQSSSDPLSAFMSDLGACWPLAQHYREKRVKYYGSEGALFTVGAPAGAATAAGEVAEGTGDAYEPAASAAGDDYAPDPTEFAEIDDSAVDAMVALASPVVHNPAHLALFARASSAIELSVGAERTLGAAAVGPSAAEGGVCRICGFAGGTCGCEAAKALAGVGRGKASPKVPAVLRQATTARPKPASRDPFVAPAHTSGSAAAAGNMKLGKRRRTSVGSASVGPLLPTDGDEEEVDALDELLFTYMPDSVGNLGLMSGAADALGASPAPNTPSRSTPLGWVGDGLGTGSPWTPIVPPAAGSSGSAPRSEGQQVASSASAIQSSFPPLVSPQTPPPFIPAPSLSSLPSAPYGYPMPTGQAQGMMMLMPMQPGPHAPQPQFSSQQQPQWVIMMPQYSYPAPSTGPQQSAPPSWQPMPVQAPPAMSAVQIPPQASTSEDITVIPPPCSSPMPTPANGNTMTS